jgi:hypothetical protein
VRPEKHRGVFLSKPANDLRPDGAKLKLAISGKGEIEITGNQLGLKALSRICADLSESVGQEGSHCHLMDVEGFWGTERGSMPLIIDGDKF